MNPDRLNAVYQALIAQQGRQTLAGNMPGNPYGIGNPAGSAVLPPEAYPHGIAPPGYQTASTDAPPGEGPADAYSMANNLPPAATGVAPVSPTGQPTVYAPGGPQPSGTAPVPAPYIPTGWIMPSPDYVNHGYPNLRGRTSGDWMENASHPPYNAPIGPSGSPNAPGSAGVAGQGGSFFTTQGGLPSNYSSAEGRNNFNDFFRTGVGGKVGPMGPNLWAELMNDNMFGRRAHGSYKDYIANFPKVVNTGMVPPVLDQVMLKNKRFNPAPQ